MDAKLQDIENEVTFTFIEEVRKLMALLWDQEYASQTHLYAVENLV